MKTCMFRIGKSWKIHSNMHFLWENHDQNSWIFIGFPSIQDGQLGFGGRSRRADARPVAALGPALDIRAGGSHTCALEVP